MCLKCFSDLNLLCKISVNFLPLYFDSLLGLFPLCLCLIGKFIDVVYCLQRHSSLNIEKTYMIFVRMEIK